jgi:GntR family transcriptional regulator, transcriptional repressor for pyruvate dehydrogenase complex
MNTGLRRETLPEQLADELVSLIERRNLAPGDFLPGSSSLAEGYGVSRPVVREALRMLEARGVIRTKNGRGAVIQPISHELLRDYFSRAVSLRKESLVELLEVRKGLEVESASLAAQRATDPELERISDLVRAMGAALGHAQTYAELDAQVHLEIASAAHNTMLRYLIESIREPLKTSIEAGLRSRENFAHLQRVQELHEDLARALSAHDSGQATTIMALHFDEAVIAIASSPATISEEETEKP